MVAEEKNEVEAVQQPSHVVEVSNQVSESHEMVQATVTDTSCIQEDAQIVEQATRYEEIC